MPLYPFEFSFEAETHLQHDLFWLLLPFQSLSFGAKDTLILNLITRCIVGSISVTSCNHALRPGPCAHRPSRRSLGDLATPRPPRWDDVLWESHSGELRVPGPGITIDLDVALKHAAALIDALYEVPNPSHLRLKHVFVLDPAHFLPHQPSDRSVTRKLPHLVYSYMPCQSRILQMMATATSTFLLQYCTIPRV